MFLVSTEIRRRIARQCRRICSRRIRCRQYYLAPSHSLLHMNDDSPSHMTRKAQCPWSHSLWCNDQRIVFFWRGRHIMSNLLLLIKIHQFNFNSTQKDWVYVKAVFDFQGKYKRWKKYSRQTRVRKIRIRSMNQYFFQISQDFRSSLWDFFVWPCRLSVVA